MPVVVSVPQIQSAYFDSNPVNMNSKTNVTVTIEETNKTLYEQYKYCGIARSGGAL